MSIATTRSGDRLAGARFLAPESRKAGTLLRWAKRIVRHMQIQRQRRVLESMPDWILKDVGINRSDIDSITIHLVDGRVDDTVVRRPR